MNLLNILFALIFLGIIIAFHEFGHFIVAKLTHIPVEEFAIGMGPQILKIQGKETMFSLRLLPVGGYVRYFDEFEDESKASEGQPADARAFMNTPAWKRALTILAGPVMNLVFALIVMVFFYSISGIYVADSAIASVEENSAAYGVFEAGDDIIAIEGEAIPEGEAGFERCKEILYSNEKTTYEITILRGGQTMQVQLTPATEGDMRIGVTFDTMRVRLGPIAAIGAGVKQIANLVQVFVDFIKNIFKTGISLNDFAGPVGIVSEISSAASRGISDLLSMLIVISVSVGLFNLLPFPALDGGRLLIYVIEMIRGKRLAANKENIINLVGFVLLLLLVIAVTVNDILR